MKSQDPERYSKVKQIEDAILAGEKKDPKTGRENKLGKDDEIVELEPEDHLWLWLANKLGPAVPPDGSLPLPSEAREVFERGLGNASIRHPENQLHVLATLEHYFAGRAEGLAVRFEKKDKNKNKGRRKGRRQPTRTPPRARRR